MGAAFASVPETGIRVKTWVKNRLAGFRPCFAVRDLVFIGIFAAVMKAVTLIIAFAGGGMNPLTLFIKNFVYTALMLVLVHKVRKPWTMTMAVLVTCLISFLLMGQGILHTPGALAACLLAELLILLLGGYENTVALVLGVLFMELATKAVSVAISLISLREQPGLILTVLVFVGIGAVGSVVGIGGGLKFVKELRHASILPQ